MMSKEYPKFKYHKSYEETKRAVIIHSAEDEKRLNDEWSDSPVDFGIVTHPEVKPKIDPSVLLPSDFVKEAAKPGRKKKEDL